MALVLMGFDPEEAIEVIKKRRPGAIMDEYKSYIASYEQKRCKWIRDLPLYDKYMYFAFICMAAVFIYDAITMIIDTEKAS